ncbi:flippase [Reichenbachiella ulvae]|uniref:Flippase n=1 Tax=Reichenbachiella ulvae TaxID=2980104 RepID=A0ABT3CY35_9BACT|nr:flippase [Reichenbachiella ulvae]MCV9388486.1 flippase [Reichenbachiella ulvae]
MNDKSFGSKKIFWNTGFLFVEKVFSFSVSFITSVYVIRYLGPEEFGLLEYANSIVAILLPLSRLGLMDIVVKELVSKGSPQISNVVSTSFTTIFISGCVFFALTCLNFYFLGSEKTLKWLVILTSVRLLFQSFEVFDCYFKSKVAAGYSVLARVTFQVSVSALKLVGVILKMGLFYFALTTIIGLLLQAIVLITSYLVLYDKPKIYLKINLHYAKSLVLDSWPLLISGLSTIIYMKIDQIMLKYFVSQSDLGNYAVAARLSELWYFIPMAIISSVYPSIIKSRSNVKLFQTRFQQLFDVILAISLCLALPITFFGEEVVLFLYGFEYQKSGSVLILHIWACLFGFMGLVQTKWMILKGQQRIKMTFNLAGAVLNILLNLYMIPWLGVIGAAWSTILSLCISNWLLAGLRKGTREVFIVQSRAFLNVIAVKPILMTVRKIIFDSKI